MFCCFPFRLPRPTEAEQASTCQSSLTSNSSTLWWMTFHSSKQVIKSVDTETQNWKITRSTITTTQWIFIPFSSSVSSSCQSFKNDALFVFQNGSKWETKYKSAPFQEHLKVLKKDFEPNLICSILEKVRIRFIRRPWKTNLFCWHLSAECCKVLTKCFDEQFCQRAFREKFKSILWNFLIWIGRHCRAPINIWWFLDNSVLAIIFHPWPLVYKFMMFHLYRANQTRTRCLIVLYNKNIVTVVYYSNMPECVF